ncbi:MAG: Smr/MutS family protein [Deltaproteobacteria bacterium]|nr:Smr/MutS family protein [Deltaproteobacteria bacterium]
MQESLHSKSAEALGWPELLAELAARCHSERARTLAHALPLADSAEAVNALLDCVCEARVLHERGYPLPFEELDELRPALLRLSKEGVLAPATLIRVARTLRIVDALHQACKTQAEGSPALWRLARDITPLEGVWRTIGECFTADGEIADYASFELGEAREKVGVLGRRVIRRLRRLMERPHIARHLQDRFFTQRENRFVLPIRSDAGGSIEGIVLGSSARGATLFIEPKEVVELNNQIKVAQVTVEREEARILFELSELVAENRSAIERNLEIGTELDLLNARARLAMAMDAARPKVQQAVSSPSALGPRLVLRRARHPLMTLTSDHVVPLDVEIDHGGGLVISGPNAGGKTVALKTVGLCALMLRGGMLLPATLESQVPIYGHVLAAIGDAQSIEMNLSTFTAHVEEMRCFFERADPHTLLLIDELMTGTDPGEGEALAQAMLEALVERCGQLLVTTHYERLKALPTTDTRFHNANVGFDLAEMKPTFELHHDAPGSSFALAVARRQGLGEAIATRAQSLMADEETRLSELLLELAELRTKLGYERQEAERAISEAEERRRTYDSQLALLKQRGHKELAAAHATAFRELKQARLQFAEVRSRLKRLGSRDQLRDVDRIVSTAATAVVRHEPREELPAGQPASASTLRVGTKVQIPHLGGMAEVVEPPQRGKVTVSLGGMRSVVKIEHLQLPPTSQRRESQERKPTPKKDHQAPPSSSPVVPERHIDNTLDLRGQRVDDALRELDRFIDESLLASRDEIYVLHGYGSGALMDAVRKYVGAASTVSHWRSGEKNEGGNAVTYIELR